MGTAAPAEGRHGLADWVWIVTNLYLQFASAPYAPVHIETSRAHKELIVMSSDCNNLNQCLIG